ncbi:MAG: nuclear transport factor 2 family protein [Bosea sp.]|uniref:nuclear transport factor 2 family protein n=1 Tax=Bosea sp. (in: a-proteobacteria) TaxID=1871050 RepID=UPI002396F1C3|nr:nuclear transport factor 2 family protein [Bosea sp. (in: a-proteobacteria)]MCP4740571.1 nuclear transport factor 2 family protein [Bosea sp. (in: a-proteobacteria)]
MYHGIVQARVRALFDAVNKGDAEPVIAAFAPIFEHRFLGDDHALGGSCSSLSAVRDWYGRLYRLLPDIHFDLERIDVVGPPWNTVVVVDWRETNSGTDGVRTFNRGHHVLHLAWGAGDAPVDLPGHDAAHRDARPALRSRQRGSACSADSRLAVAQVKVCARPSGDAMRR